MHKNLKLIGENFGSRTKILISRCAYNTICKLFIKIIFKASLFKSFNWTQIIFKIKKKIEQISLLETKINYGLFQFIQLN